MTNIHCHILIDMLRLLLRGHGLTLTMVCSLSRLRKTCLNLILVFMKLIEVDFQELERSVPIPELCDHRSGRCNLNGCWRGYPQAPFPHWTVQQVKKAKIYEAIRSNYPRNKPCICYQLDLNDHGLFTYTKEMVGAYGEEEIFWDSMIREEVS